MSPLNKYCPCATVSSCGRGSQQPVTTPEKVLYGQRFMASGQPSTIRPSDDQPSVGVPSPNVPSDDQCSVSVQVLMYQVIMINLLQMYQILLMSL